MRRLAPVFWYYRCVLEASPRGRHSERGLVLLALGGSLFLASAVYGEARLAAILDEPERLLVDGVGWILPAPRRASRQNAHPR